MCKSKLATASDQSQQASEADPAVHSRKAMRAKKAAAPERHLRRVRATPRPTRSCFRIVIDNEVLRQVISAGKDVLIAYAPYAAHIIIAVVAGGCLIYSATADKPILAPAALNLWLFFGLVFGKVVERVPHKKSERVLKKPPDVDPGE